MYEQKKALAVPKVGLVLTGGGARAAYQVGVLRAIAELLPDKTRNPFPIICGTSAGAINAASIAVSASNFAEGVGRLEEVWSNFHVDQIYRSDLMGVIHNTLRCMLSLVSSEYGQHNPISLLDNAPLEALLKNRFSFRTIQHCIRSGSLHALGLTAWGYTSGQSVTFYQAAREVLPWKRAQRLGLPVEIGVEHLMASSSIPFIFPAVKLNREFFGDGSMRQLAPISPALHLGADKVLIIGVRKPVTDEPKRISASGYPPFAQIAGHALNSIFVDSLDVDLERLLRINETLKLIPPEAFKANNISLRPIEAMMIAPSEGINEIAQKYAHTLPWIMRYLYRAIGAMGPNGSTLLSYVLFEVPFCRDLIELGYNDTMQQKNELLKFIGVQEKV
ncbi:MAG: patatin-like phospholipase family protein [Nitrosomonas sp.]|uniref:patatin-like phospholipase family protein n=1 Tax=Nitrosomonas sp. TaxID=42353 RepID=UPI0025DBC73C|nr:patatin-like phospholipase family protein [Nitrosomonas sp.]UJP03086.1 MAG: patatin-like phospholipase family protein [Nitrosomonas sp.]